MLELDAHRFVGFTNTLRSITKMRADNPQKQNQAGQADPHLAISLREHAEQLAEMGLRTTKGAVLDLAGSIECYGPYNDLADAKVGFVCRTLHLETDGLKFLHVENEDLYNKGAQLFSPDMSIKYPNASYEIDEACKCLALERGTACMFHLMRTMELSVRATAKCLQIPDPIKPSDHAWGPIQKTIDDAMKIKWPTAASRQSGDGAIFDSINAMLAAVRSPWRNPTMHIDKVYTTQQAGDVLDAVRGFMRVVISRFDEQGQPYA